LEYFSYSYLSHFFYLARVRDKSIIPKDASHIYIINYEIIDDGVKNVGRFFSRIIHKQKKGNDDTFLSRIQINTNQLMIVTILFFVEVSSSFYKISIPSRSWLVRFLLKMVRKTLTRLYRTSLLKKELTWALRLSGALFAIGIWNC